LGAALRWAWQTGLDRDWPELEAGCGIRLPLHAQVQDAPGWWGMAAGLLVNGTFFITLLFGYLYLWVVASAWPPASFISSPIILPGIAAAAVLASALGLHGAVQHNAAGRQPVKGLAVALAAALIAAVMLIAQITAVASPTTHAYAAVTTFLLGYCALHAALTVVLAGFALLRWRKGFISPRRSLDLRVIRLWTGYTAVVTLVALGLVHGLPAVTAVIGAPT
jgi:cytochrome c oxidase subunit I+III